MKRNVSKLLAIVLCLAMCLSLLPAGVFAADAPIKIACIGDSITYGHNPADWGRTQIQNNWPTVLGQTLGDGYEVKNFGQNGITLSKGGGTPVWNIEKFTQSKDYQPDIVIIMLGTNDSPGSDAAEKQESLKADLRELITVYRDLDSHPTVYIATCATGFGNGGFGLPPANIHDYIVPLQKEVAAEMGCKIIDVHDFTSDMASDFPDNIHPNEAGHAAIGKFVADFILAEAGGTDPGDDPPPEPGIPIYEDTSYSFAERAADLIARMSLQQKASQLVERAAAIPASQLGGGAMNVPATKDLSHYSWWAEALHGLLRDNENPQSEGTKDNVSYAQSLTMGSTWNPDLYYEGATLIADEIRERSRKNELGNCINLNFYSPTINMQRDPRWGRNEEAYSEDPLLNATMGTQFVLGMEGKDQDGNPLDPNGYLKSLTTIKHYTANNTEAIRTSGGADNVDLRALREYYVAPYRDVIRASDVRSVMTAYSYVNKEPCSYSSYLMDTLLRQTFGFTGHITSDCDSAKTISNLNYTNPRTGAKLTSVEQMAGALAHGEDLECNSGISANVGDYNQLATQMVSAGVQTDKGTFTENTIDVSVHRLMTARIATGEFDEENPWTAAANERMADQAARGINNYTPERIAVVDREVDEGVVMLKNNGVLPLQIPATGDYKVVIIGEHQTNSYLGLYSSEQRHAEDDKWRIWIGPGIEQAIKDVNPDATVTRINSNTISNEDAIRAADAVIVVTGTGSGYSSEGRDRSNTDLPNNQAQLISNVGKMNPNTVCVMETCGPMTVTAFENDVAAILWSSFGGIRKGVGFGHVITGKVNPSGHLTATWHQSMNDIPGIRDYNLYATNGSHGRTYMYYDGTVPVSYPFGYGLSYTTFAYSNLKIDKTAYDANDTVKVTFDVKNTGTVAGKDVAQLYVAQPDAPAELNRPIRRLEGFDKFELQPGQTKTVALEVKIPDLAYYNEEADKFEVDTGKYQIQVGEDSAHANLTADFTVSGAMDEYPVVLSAKPNQEGDEALGIEQRIIFDKGATINPQLTVAMNNEKLYGYIIKEQTSIIKSLSSTPLPEGMTFTYESNRPEVAKVEGDKITAAGPGVATITVTGEKDGHTVTTDFVVYVMSNVKLDGITIDGEPIAKFSPDKYKYNVTLDSKAHKPVVAATASNPDLKIRIDQVKTLPGVCTITTKDPDSGVTATYEINFKVKASGGGYVLASEVKPGGTYVIVADDTYALNAQASGDTLGATEVTVSGDTVTGDIDDTVLWTFQPAEGVDPAGDGNDLYLISNGDGNSVRRGSGGGALPLSLAEYDAANSRYFTWSLTGRTEEDGAYTLYLNGSSSRGYYPMVGAETGFNAQYIATGSWDPQTSGSSIKLYEYVQQSSGLPSIDFTTEADAGKYEISGQSQSEVEEGVGLALVSSQGGIEPAKQSIAEQDIDVVRVPVSGDWTATLETEFDTNGAANGYYQFFGFFASMGGDNQNMVGIRGGDGAMQDFIRTDGAITEEQRSSSPGFDTTGKTYYLRIEKVGDSYICYRSDDGEEFTEIFTYESTGIEADEILIDAYTGMTTGYKFTLKSLTFEGGGGGEVEDPAINSITVDGDSVGLIDGVYVYNFEVAKDSTKVPVVAAKAGNSSTKVKVEQLTGPFGTATVTATAGSKTLTYKLSFNHTVEDDYFADGDYAEDLWEIENKSGSKVEKGKGIVMPAQSGEGGFKDLYLMPGMGNWAVVAKVFCPTAPAEGQMPMLILSESPENNTAVIPEAPVAAADGSVTLYLKLESKDNIITESWSQDGLEYKTVGTVDDKLFANPKLGLLSTAEAYYEFVCVTSAGGVEQYNMPDMLTWAAQNVADYVAADLPDATKEDLRFSPIPHGYELTVVSSDPAVIAADGKVTVPAEEKDVTVTVTIKEGATTASATKTIKVSADAPNVVNKDELAKAIEEAKALDLSQYTEESAAAIQAAIDAAEAVMADEDATQDAVDAAIEALKEAIGPEPFLFEDVKDPGKFYFDPVYWAFNADPQITKGTDDTHFGPDNACTRGHVVTFLWRAAGEPEPKSTQTPFTDLKPGAFYEKAVAWAVEEGITKGMTDTTFAPDGKCNRGQIVTFLWRFKGEPAPKSTQTPFTDLKAGAFYEKAVAWAVENEVTNGMTATTFGPEATCTRGQVVTFLYRATAE